jgi:cellulase/cellobiase CelA1
MPPGRGVGLRPTADTKVPLVDAYLWTDLPGMSFASCDIAGGARAWDYSKYNPWGITGDAQNHFDPLWGMVLPPTGAWFPEEALQLARNANPPLEEIGSPETTVLEGESGMRGPTMPGAIGAPPSPIGTESKARLERALVADRAASADARPEVTGRPATKPVARPGSRPARRPAGAPPTTEVSNPPSAPTRAEKSGATPPTFDPDNPYR